VFYEYCGAADRSPWLALAKTLFIFNERAGEPQQMTHTGSPSRRRRQKEGFEFKDPETHSGHVQLSMAGNRGRGSFLR